MGLNDEYSRDAYAYEQIHDSDDSDDDFDPELHPEDWQDMYSDELLDAWMKIREYADENMMNNTGSYPLWVDFVLDGRKWFTWDPPEPWQRVIWNAISRIPVVEERVSPEAFFGWSYHYITYY